MVSNTVKLDSIEEQNDNCTNDAPSESSTEDPEEVSNESKIDLKANSSTKIQVQGDKTAINEDKNVEETKEKEVSQIEKVGKDDLHDVELNAATPLNFNHFQSNPEQKLQRAKDVEAGEEQNGNDNQDKPKNNDSSNGYIRHMIAILTLSSIVLANVNRQAFNQALTSMIRKVEDSETTTITNVMNLDVTTTGYNTELLIANSSSGSIETFDTTEQTESYVNQDTDEDKFSYTANQIAQLQAGFSYGYTPLMILGGRVSEIYGAKWVVFTSGFGSALCCLFAPFFADTSYHLLFMSRVLMGLSQTGVSPALYAVISRWLPSDEANFYLPMIKVAVQIGFMLGSLASGFTHWRLTFYMVGLIGVAWSILWAIVASSEPKDNRFITEKELKFIKKESSEHSNKDNEDNKLEKKTGKESAPWIGIFTNTIVLAFMFSKFTVKLSTDMQSVQIPVYLDKVFKVSKQLNGVLTGMNFAIQAIFTGLIAYMSKEFVVNRKFGLSKTGVRRLFQGICNFGMAASYVLITFNMGSLELVCVAIILLSVCSMFGAGGEPMTPLDLSIEFSASIMAIANSTANISGIILPQIVSFVLGDETTSSAGWNIVLVIVASIIAFGGLVYCCVVRAEVQDFGRNREKKLKIEQDIRNNGDKVQRL